jgi:hypothetical protein
VRITKLISPIMMEVLFAILWVMIGIPIFKKNIIYRVLSISFLIGTILISTMIPALLE